MDRRSFIVGAAGGTAAVPLALKLHGEPPKIISPSVAVTTYCSAAARDFVSAHKANNLRQHHVDHFVDAHRLGIAHLREIGAIDQATQYIRVNRRQLPLTPIQITEAQRIYNAYAGLNVEGWRFSTSDQGIDALLAMGLDTAAENVLQLIQVRATALVLPAQDTTGINQMQQIADMLMAVGAFWGLGGLVGCIVCAVGGAIIGIGGVLLCWVYC